MTTTTRPEVEKLLKTILSVREAKKLFSGGWKAVRGERKAEADELEARIAELSETLRNKTHADVS